LIIFQFPVAFHWWSSFLCFGWYH